MSTTSKVHGFVAGRCEGIDITAPTTADGVNRIAKPASATSGASAAAATSAGGAAAGNAYVQPPQSIEMQVVATSSQAQAGPVSPVADGGATAGEYQQLQQPQLQQQAVFVQEI